MYSECKRVAVVSVATGNCFSSRAIKEENVATAVGDSATLASFFSFTSSWSSSSFSLSFAAFVANFDLRNDQNVSSIHQLKDLMQVFLSTTLAPSSPSILGASLPDVVSASTNRLSINSSNRPAIESFVSGPFVPVALLAKVSLSCPSDTRLKLAIHLTSVSRARARVWLHKHPSSWPQDNTRARRVRIRFDSIAT